MQQLVWKERREKLEERKKMYPDVVGATRLPKNAFKFYEETLMQSIRPKKVKDSEQFMETAKILSTNAFKIAEHEDQNNPALVINSKCFTISL
jgi:hypothetical protein